MSIAARTDSLSLAPSRTADEYWQETKRPWVSLLFLAPLLLLYEYGVLYFGGSNPERVRNGADYWLRSLLQQFGWKQDLLPPVLITVGLLAWHLAGRYPWRFRWETLVGMLAESVLFAFVLVIVGRLTDLAFRKAAIPPVLSMTSSQVSQAVTYLGAGIYEETMFRLCLLPLAYGLFRLTRVESRHAALLSILLTSLMFSLAHHIGPSAEAIQWFPFTFRVLAGMFFAGLFFVRGFGIAVGCHAAYDLLVGVWHVG